MFRNLLLRGMEDVLFIFNDAKAKPVQEVRFSLTLANSEAEKSWNNATKSFLLRKSECGKIISGVLQMNQIPKSATSTPVPQPVGEQLASLFNKHYWGKNLFLIGRTTEEAYKLQDRYGEDVVELLATVSVDYQSRAITRLQTVYGVSSMPLLCTSSVSATWELCQSPFYKKQISLVSSLLLPSYICVA